MSAINPTSVSRTVAGRFRGTDTPTTERVASAAHTAVDTAAANLKKAEHALREARAAAGHKAADVADQAGEFSEHAVSAAKTYMNHYPVRSIGIGIAIAYLLYVAVKK